MTYFTKMILQAMGLSAAFVAANGCGTEVIVQPGDGGGDGSGGSGASGSVTSGPTTGPTTTGPTTSGKVPFTCGEPPLGQNVYACVPTELDGSCPTKQEAQPQLDDILSGSCETSDPDFCGCWEYVDNVPCGPDPNVNDSCCYYATVVRDEFCEGRPYTDAGHALFAQPARRRDWCADLGDGARPCVAALDDATRASLAAAWTEDALHEHASVASFARFVMELLAVGAPPGMIRDAQQALRDEVRHAELCFGMASAYAAAPVGPSTLPISATTRSDLVAVAVATLVEGCINETLATLVAHAAAAEASDPAARAALEEIARDESRHAALAWRFVAWACRRDDRVRRAIAKAFDEAGPSGAGSDHPGDRDALRAHGQLCAAERRRVITRGYAEVVLPAGRALIASLGDTGSAIREDARGRARDDVAMRA